MPTIPITIIKHGEFDTRALQKRYNLMVIEQKDVDPRLQKKSFGYGFTKMIAFWHAPFDRFVHIDPDSVCRAIR